MTGWEGEHGKENFPAGREDRGRRRMEGFLGVTLEHPPTRKTERQTPVVFPAHTGNGKKAYPVPRSMSAGPLVRP